MSNLWKRSLSFALALMMVVSMVPMQAFATETETEETTLTEVLPEETAAATEVPVIEETEAPAETEVPEETEIPEEPSAPVIIEETDIITDEAANEVVEEPETTDVAMIGETGYETLADAISAAASGDTVLLVEDVTAVEIISIDKAITLDGNGKKLTSTAGRAINVTGAAANGVTIKNLTINVSGERGINVIQNANNVRIENCTIKAANYAVNATNTAPGAVITIVNSDLTGLNVVNIASANAEVTVTNTKILCNDQSATENYSALALNQDAVGASIVATDVTFDIKGDSRISSNDAEGGSIVVNGNSGNEAEHVAIIEYGNNYYGFTTLEAAIEKAVAGETIKLLRDVTASEIISIDKAITLDGNGKKLTSTAGRAINVETSGNVVISNLTIQAAERAVNIINQPANVTLNNVTATAKNNAVMLATSAENANLTVNDSHLTGLATVNVASANSVVEINDTTIVNVDASAAENYGAITVSPSGENATVTVNGGEITVADDSRKAYVFPGNATVKGVDDVGYIIATIGDAGFESLEDAIAYAKNGEMIKMVRDVTASAIITIDKAITLDGNGKKLTSTAARAINVSGADGVTIKNLTIDVTGERGINVIQNATNVLIEDCTIKAANYTVNAASSAPGAVITIKNSDLTGLNVVNIGAPNAKVTVTDGTILCNDQNENEGYGALSLNKDAVGGSIVANGVAFAIMGNSNKAVNAAEGGSIIIDGQDGEAVIDVAVVEYGNYYYGFDTVEKAIEYATAGETVKLIRDVTASAIITIDKAITLDGNGKKLTSTAARAINVETSGNVVISNLTIQAAERAVNIINQPANVTLNNVTATAKNNAVMLATSAENANLTVNDSHLTGLATVNVASANSVVVINDTAIVNVDATEAENYGAITVSASAENATVTVNGGEITVADDSRKAYVFPGNATVKGVDDVGYIIATIGDAGFESLEEAISYAKNGETIDVVRGLTISKDAEMTLDLMGKTISMNVAATKTSALITNNGTLTIKDSVGGGKLTYVSSIVNTGYSTSVIINNGTLTVESGIIENTSAKGGASYAVDNYNTLTVNGGTFIANGTSIRQAQFGNHDNTVIINGGESTGYAGLQLHVFSTAKKTTTVINGGTFNGTYAMYTTFDAAEDSGNTDITINGGTFNGTSAALFLYNSKTGAAEFSAAVKGGNFNSGIYAYIKNAEGEKVNLPIVSGGIFSEIAMNETDPAVLTENLGFAIGENGKYILKSTNDGILDTEAELVAAIAAGGEVKLDADINLVNPLTNSGNVILNLNGHTLSHVAECTSSYQMINNKGSLTITGNGKISFTDTGAGDPAFGWGSYTIYNTGTLVVENGTIEHLGAQSFATHCILAIFNYSGSTTILGGTISTPNYRSVRLWHGSLTIKGGTLDGQVWVQTQQGAPAELAIEGGSFGPNGRDGSSVYITNDENTVALSVSGGYFPTKIGAYDAQAMAGAITGGVFGESAMKNTNATLISENLVFATNEDGNYILKSTNDGILDTEAELAAAVAAGGEVKLDADINLVNSLTNSGNVTLNLNGKTVSLNVAATKTSALITNNGTLTIKDSVGGGKLVYASSVVNTGYSTSTIINNGTLTVESGIIENASAKGGASYAVDNYNTLTVNGGTFIANGTSIRQAQFGNHDNTVIINGGESSGYAGLQLHIFSAAKKTTTVINGGTFNGDYAMYSYFYKAEDSGNTDITVNGGAFNGSSAALYLYNHNAGSAEFNAAVKGGNFNGGVYVFMTNTEGEYVDLPVITGGTFSEGVAEEYCAVGYAPVLNADGTYRVEKEEFSLVINHSYIAIEVDKTFDLDAIAKPDRETNSVKWTVESDKGIITVDQNGLVTAKKVGTDYVLATMGSGDNKVTARCRVDVTEEDIKIEAVQLSTNKVTTELFSTNYAKLDVILLLEQNQPDEMTKSANIITDNATNGVVGLNEEDAGLSITAAKFKNDAYNELFTLEIVDDRTLMVVPNLQKVQDNPGAFKSSYKSEIVLTIRGEEITTELVSLTVKKTKPSVKATVEAFNSFYTYETRQIVFTGATVEKVALNPAKALPAAWLTVAGPAPAVEDEINWMNPDEVTLSLTADQVPVKSTSTNVYLKVMTAEWVIPVDVTLAVKNTYKARSLKLSASSISISAENSTGITLTLKPGNAKETWESLNVSDIEVVTDGFYVDTTNLIENGTFVLTTDQTFTNQVLQLKVLFNDTEAKLALPNLKVKQVAPKITMAPATVKLNALIDDSVTVKLNATPADFQIGDVTLSLTDRNNKPVAENFDKLAYTIDPVTNEITVKTTATTVSNEVYYLYATAGSAKAKLTVQTIGKAPTMSLAAKGNIDLSFPETAAVITTKLANCNQPDANFSIEITNSKKVDVTENFKIEPTADGYEILAGEGLETGSYTAKITALLNENEEGVDEIKLVKTAKITVKRTAVKLKLTTTKVSLNKKLGDVATVGVSCTTKGYQFEEPFLTYDKNLLDINYVDGNLLVGLTDKAEFGKTYKVTVRAHEGAASAVTLNVVVLKKDAVVKSTIKATGMIDVIRDNTMITIKPTYTNALNVDVENQAQLVFYSNANKDNYKTPIAAEDVPFDVTVEDGVFVLTANEKLLATVSYKAELVTTFGEEPPIKSAKIALRVKMNNAKLVLHAEKTNKMYAKDINSRVTFSIVSTDATVNAIRSVEVLDSKLSAAYRGIFKVIEYGNGEYAIGFVEGANISKVQGKTVNVPVNVFIEGNESTKTNATLTLKITVVK